MLKLVAILISMAYAEKLHQLGVEVKVKSVADLVHGSLRNFNHSINTKAAAETAPLLDTKRSLVTDLNRP